MGKTVVIEKRRAEDPLTMMRRPELQKLCRERGIPYDPSTTTAREMLQALREAGAAEQKQPGTLPSIVSGSIEDRS